VTVHIASWRSLPETKNKNTNDTKKKYRNQNQAKPEEKRKEYILRRMMASSGQKRLCIAMALYKYVRIYRLRIHHREQRAVLSKVPMYDELTACRSSFIEPRKHKRKGLELHGSSLFRVAKQLKVALQYNIYLIFLRLFHFCSLLLQLSLSLSLSYACFSLAWLTHIKSKRKKNERRRIERGRGNRKKRGRRRRRRPELLQNDEHLPRSLTSKEPIEKG
jgi:hypothetical protein